MRKKLSLILCIALIISLMPATSAFAAKTVKAKSVSIAPKAMTLMVGDIAQLKATKNPKNSTNKLTWTSSNKSVATVTSKGVVQGVSEGTATITVKTSNNKKASCTVVVKNYIDENSIRESLREELKAEFATKNDIQALISQNTYTKSEIDSKIASVPSGGGGSTVVNNCDCGKDFTDGQSLSLLAGQSLPFTIDRTLWNGEKISITITSVSIKKYHYNKIFKENYNPFKYTLEIKGKVPDFSNVPNDTDPSLTLVYVSKDKDSSAAASYYFENEDGGKQEATYSVEGDDFTLTVNQYGIYSDYEYFFIEALELGV